MLCKAVSYTVKNQKWLHIDNTMYYMPWSNTEIPLENQQKICKVSVSGSEKV